MYRKQISASSVVQNCLSSLLLKLDIICLVGYITQQIYGNFYLDVCVISCHNCFKYFLMYSIISTDARLMRYILYFIILEFDHILHVKACPMTQNLYRKDLCLIHNIAMCYQFNIPDI